MRLEPFAAEHLPAVEGMVGDPEVLHNTRIPEPPPADFTEGWLRSYEERRAIGTAEAWVVLADDGAFLGMGMAPEIDRDGREVELGYIVGPDARGRGVATEILVRLTQWAFDKAGALRVTLLIDVENLASIRVAEKAGYVREGVLRSLHVKQERRADTALYSRLPTDPEPTG